MAQTETRTNVPSTASKFESRLPGFTVKQYALVGDTGVMAVATASDGEGKIVIAYENVFHPCRDAVHAVEFEVDGSLQRAADAGGNLCATEAIEAAVDIATTTSEVYDQ